ncbi:hypothetical protein A3C65_03370 [Candidatus Nomurabacteria bacterium RIFCSPHIGHO2_02_FULL_41_150]|nr:MAG: hypothetical protein A3C65_03370 [Candidatus Nomurabacteria bacterium RIFCSPHIGHO2_02_FULL_41_150]
MLKSLVKKIKMKNKIKEFLYFVTTALVITFLGFAPMAQKTAWALDWGDLGSKMLEAGVIDKEKFEDLYNQRGGLSEMDKKLLYGTHNKNLIISEKNSGMMLNMLWAFGLANENPILENGPMMDPKYGGAGNFASTGGWNLAKGSAMNHFSMHKFVTLTPEQQALVEKVAKNVYRPCCQNSTYFPDCNHGMAMLGLLELMASQGAKEEEMNKVAEEVNGYWFPPIKTSNCGA